MSAAPAHRQAFRSLNIWGHRVSGVLGGLGRKFQFDWIERSGRILQYVRILGLSPRRRRKESPMSVEFTETDAKTAACRYVLLMLLQRLDSKHPGLVDEMLTGAIADFAAIEANGKLDDSLRKVLVETKTLLQQAGSHKNNLPSQGKA